MLCFAKFVLTEDLYIVQQEEFSIICCMCDTYIFIRGKPIFSSERVLNKIYGCKGSVEKRMYLVVSLKGIDAKTN
jgi:hypothetical protein